MLLYGHIEINAFVTSTFMSGNSFGTLFRITTWGESHGGGVGVVIDGCPPKVEISVEDIQQELDRRRPGQSHITTPRDETDTVEILSGVFEGKTLGTPISMMVRNKDADSSKYENLKDTYRPSHSDFTYEKKYGIRNWAGGGRSSARETIGRVAAGAIAKKILQQEFGLETLSYVKQVHEIETEIDANEVKLEDIEANIVRCPDASVAEAMIKKIEEVKQEGDTVGGVIETIVKNVPAGLGEPVFDKLEAVLAHAMLSLPAAKGFEIGSGFAGTTMTGSTHNDPFVQKDGKVGTTTNHSGGIQGGISNGEPIIFRVAFKPVSTIFKKQETVTKAGEKHELQMQGRHDPCVLPRAVPIIEAMTNIVLLDHYLQWRGQTGS